MTVAPPTLSCQQMAAVGPPQGSVLAPPLWWSHLQQEEEEEGGVLLRDFGLVWEVVVDLRKTRTDTAPEGPWRWCLAPPTAGQAESGPREGRLSNP